jgi:hypothetical protein
MENEAVPEPRAMLGGGLALAVAPYVELGFGDF